ncbi:hypothetical protein LK994_05575 [Ferruginibacter lapsinanis]|uniref:hypothetical protein n=1 Tax=Ferruginibacter lapsinanis TaxID=563172 RepID=UPI001E4AA617|nr:hypothetical protein [Ferruginibacter lapsinanis]UEG50942.1 hypothetical protein LK994_05575 [Ferruginibacter lapsinanis]
MQQEIIKGINKDLAISLPEQLSFEELQRLLAMHVNHLIKTNFEKLVSILYRIDVSEHKLKQLLKENNDDAGKIIANAIIERELQKIKSRQQFSRRDNNINEDEKW